MLTDLWLRSFSTSQDAAAQLVCFPHAGGSAGYFRTLSTLLGPTIDVRAIQYPGRQDRHSEPMPADLKTLASMIVDVIQGSAPKTRAFFGHSMGAVVAYETARSIGSDGKPTALFVSGRRAPSSTRPDEDHMLDEQSLVNKVLSLGGTDVQALLDSDVRQMVMPVIRRDYQLVECYRHSAGPKLDLPIIGLVGEHDAMTTIDEADAWRNHTSGPFTLHRFPGGHFFLNEHPRAVADIISRSLNPGKDAAVNDMLGRGGSELLRGWLLAWPLYR